MFRGRRLGWSQIINSLHWRLFYYILWINLFHYGIHEESSKSSRFHHHIILHFLHRRGSLLLIWIYLLNFLKRTIIERINFHFRVWINILLYFFNGISLLGEIKKQSWIKFLYFLIRIHLLNISKWIYFLFLWRWGSWLFIWSNSSTNLRLLGVFYNGIFFHIGWSDPFENRWL